MICCFITFAYIVLWWSIFKTVEFEPEFSGKMNFYVSAVDDLLRSAVDNPTIGIVLCKTQDQTVVEYALRDMNKPIGISTYQLKHVLPAPLQGNLPTIEELENAVKYPVG